MASRTIATPGPPGAGRRRDKAATQQALLTAGVQVFAARGYDAATTREVAQTAGVNEQLAREALTRAIHKLPLKARIIKREEGDA